MKCNKFTFSSHALIKMFERKLTKDDIIFTVMTGEVIKVYPDDLPYPSSLIFAMIKDQPIHVVVAKDNNHCIIVTAYEPSAIIWYDDFKTRK